MSSSDGENKPDRKDVALNRRNILLAGTTLAASAIASGKAIELAQAQQSSTGSGRQPNILVIMGDDVGWFNIGAYHQGIMSGKTPNLDKLAAEGMRFTDYYAEASCTAGRANFITGRAAASHRPDDGRPGRRRRGHAGSGGDARDRPQVAGLRDRAVRQEPPGRPQQVPADGARLRRVLRLPVPPRRDVRPVLVRLSAGLDRQIRPAQPRALLGDRRGRPDRHAALGQGRQAADRRRRTAAPFPNMARTPELAGGPQGQIRHGDLRRGAGRAQQGLHGQGEERTASRSSSGTTRRACTSSPTSRRSIRR